MEGRRTKREKCAGRLESLGLEAAEVMSLGRSKRRAEKQVSLFILILFAVPVERGG